MLGRYGKPNAEPSHPKKERRSLKYNESPVIGIGYARHSDSVTLSDEDQSSGGLVSRPQFSYGPHSGESNSNLGFSKTTAPNKDVSAEYSFTPSSSDFESSTSSSTFSRRYSSGQTTSSHSLANQTDMFPDNGNPLVAAFIHSENTESSMMSYGANVTSHPRSDVTLKQSNSLYSIEGDFSDSPNGISSALSEPALCRSSPDGTPTKHDPALYCSDGLLYVRRTISLIGNERQTFMHQNDADENEDFSKYIEDDDYYVPRLAASSSAVKRRVNRKKANSQYSRSYERQADGTAVLIATRSMKDRFFGFFNKNKKQTQAASEKPVKLGSLAERTHFERPSRRNPSGPTIHSFTFSDTKIGGAELAKRRGKPSAVTMGISPPQVPVYQTKQQTSNISSEVIFKAKEKGVARIHVDNSKRVGKHFEPAVSENLEDVGKLFDSDESENSGNVSKTSSDAPLLPFRNRDGSFLTLGSDGNVSSSVTSNGLMSSPNVFLVDGQSGEGSVKAGKRDWKSQTFDLW
ncbi:uncharacterized protein LOC135486298 [Lineus longissimus]|uniref:uncharacterized protein LOC135486298 n=1 Tax=Lineus longissimus TaxID=88925 RepID=UPI002B4F157E